MRKEIPFAILIAVLFVLFVGFSLDTWYKGPQYEDYCKDVSREITTQKDCVALEGTWVNGTASPKEAITPTSNPNSNIGYCDMWSSCNEKYNAANEPYSFKLGGILLLIGALIIIYGTKFSKLESYINIGLIFGGILTIIYAIILNWQYMSESIRPIIIGVVLVAVIYLSNKYKRYILH